MIFERFHERALPVVALAGITIPAASLWTGSRAWVHKFRMKGVLPGDRIWVDVVPGAEVLQILIAAWWLECDVVLGSLLSGGSNVDSSLTEWGCSLAVAQVEHPQVVIPDGVRGPAEESQGAEGPRTSSGHRPWRLPFAQACEILEHASDVDSGQFLNVPSNWTESQSLLGLVLPALVGGKIITDDQVAGINLLTPRGQSVGPALPGPSSL